MNSLKHSSNLYVLTPSFHEFASLERYLHAFDQGKIPKQFSPLLKIYYKIQQDIDELNQALDGFDFMIYIASNIQKSNTAKIAKLKAEEKHQTLLTQSKDIEDKIDKMLHHLDTEIADHLIPYYKSTILKIIQKASMDSQQGMYSTTSPSPQ